MFQARGAVSGRGPWLGEMNEQGLWGEWYERGSDMWAKPDDTGRLAQDFILRRMGSHSNVLQ